MALGGQDSSCPWWHPCAVILLGFYPSAHVHSCSWPLPEKSNPPMPWEDSQALFLWPASLMLYLGRDCVPWGLVYRVLVDRADGAINSRFSYENWWPAARMPCWYLWPISMKGSCSQKKKNVFCFPRKSWRQAEQGLFFFPFSFSSHIIQVALQ